MDKHNAGALTWENLRITVGMFAGFYAFAWVASKVVPFLASIY